MTEKSAFRVDGRDPQRYLVMKRPEWSWPRQVLREGFFTLERAKHAPRGNQSLHQAEREISIMSHLQQGDPAPAFTATDQNGNTVSLADFEGRKRFIFFYPKANTSG